MRCKVLCGDEEDVNEQGEWTSSPTNDGKNNNLGDPYLVNKLAQHGGRQLRFVVGESVTCTTLVLKELLNLTRRIRSHMTH
jgi:hypothetical protein